MAATEAVVSLHAENLVCLPMRSQTTGEASTNSFHIENVQSFETKLVVLSFASDGDTLTTRCGGSNTAVLESDQRSSAGVCGFCDLDGL